MVWPSQCSGPSRHHPPLYSHVNLCGSLRLDLSSVFLLIRPGSAPSRSGRKCSSALTSRRRDQIAPGDSNGGLRLIQTASLLIASDLHSQVQIARARISWSEEEWSRLMLSAGQPVASPVNISAYWLADLLQTSHRSGSSTLCLHFGTEWLDRWHLRSAHRSPPFFVRLQSRTTAYREHQSIGPELHPE